MVVLSEIESGNHKKMRESKRVTEFGVLFGLLLDRELPPLHKSPLPSTHHTTQQHENQQHRNSGLRRSLLLLVCWVGSEL